MALPADRFFGYTELEVWVSQTGAGSNPTGDEEEKRWAYEI
jgi:hypothetical protein